MLVGVWLWAGGAVAWSLLLIHLPGRQLKDTWSQQKWVKNNIGHSKDFWGLCLVAFVCTYNEQIFKMRKKKTDKWWLIAKITTGADF